MNSHHALIAHTIDNRELHSIMIKDTISLSLSYRFWIVSISRAPKLAGNEYSSTAHRFSKRVHEPFQTIHLTFNYILY